MATPRLMVVFTLATAGVVLIVAALATGEWWLLPVALLAHAAGTVLTLKAIRETAKQGSKPDPVTEARLEEERKASGEDEDGAADGDEPRMAI
ncbi:MAG TPA: hypothetical protein VGR10_02610 [Thermoleophilaceae bacterium]|nr:hypothetical protein [Thermoleophilaceae bacterium]